MSNAQLVDYGIFQESCELRAHVSPATKRIYCFSRSSALEAVTGHQFPMRPTYSTCESCNGDPSCGVCGGSGRVKTAEGYLVPPESISGCRAVEIPHSWWERSGIFQATRTTDKGKCAVKIVKGMLQTGRFPLRVVPDEVDDRDMQIDGTDILVQTRLRVQVKCDSKAGPEELGGNGNLFIQLRECNPWRQY